MRKVVDLLKADGHRYLVEIIVIIVGILLAFWLNNWGEGLKDRGRKAELINNLKGELETFNLSIQRAGEYNEMNALRLDSVLNDLISLSEINGPRLRLIFSSTVGHHDIDANLRSVENALSQDGIKLLSGDNLKSKLYEFHHRTKILGTNNDYLITYWNDVITPYLIQSGHMIDFQNHAYGKGLDSERVLNLLENQEFRNIIAGKSVLQRDLSLIQLGFVGLIEEIISILDDM